MLTILGHIFGCIANCIITFDVLTWYAVIIQKCIDMSLALHRWVDNETKRTSFGYDRKSFFISLNKQCKHIHALLHALLQVWIKNL
jgi:hypothetical protein